MKKLCVVLVAAMLLSLVGCSMMNKDTGEPMDGLSSAGSADQSGIPVNNATPSGAVAGLMDAIIQWDMGVAAQFMTGGDEAQAGAYRMVLLPFIERIEYELGAERITGNTAVVDIAVTAVDASGVFTDLTVAAARYVVRETLSGRDADLQAFVADYLDESVDIGAMTRTKRFATVHMVQDGMGRWRLDSTNPENQAFYNALTGGLLDTVIELQELAERYGVAW